MKSKKSIPALILSVLFVLLASSIVFAIAGDIKPIPNRDYFPKVHSLLSQAKKSIYVSMFSIRYYSKYPDSLENQLIEDLIKAAKKGLEVKVILEQSEGWNEENTKANQEVGVMLANAGVDVYLDSPYQTTHSKLIIIDGTYTVVGSTNWTYHAIEKNNESSVLIESPEIAKFFTDYFVELKTQCPVMITPTGMEVKSEVKETKEESTVKKEDHYVASKNGDKFHHPSCKWGKRITEENKIIFKTREEATEAGYKPCKTCKP